MSIKNNLYNIFGGAGRAILFLFTIPLMVNYMGVEKFGVWALITSICNIALMLDVGIASTTMHFVSEINALETKEDVDYKTKTIIPVLLLINIVLSAIVAISFFFISVFSAIVVKSWVLVNGSLMLLTGAAATAFFLVAFFLVFFLAAMITPGCLFASMGWDFICIFYTMY